MFVPFEIECLLRLRDTPGIIKIYDFFEEQTCFVIVMEKLDRAMTLFDMANGKPFALSQSILKKIFVQLIRVNQTLFTKGIVHRDIKPENILVNLDDMSIKIIDFGSAANFRNRTEPFREFQGTLECMPPEWVLHGFYDSEAATVWSLGVTFYFALFGRYPYRTKTHIVSGKFPLLFNTGVMPEYLQFLDFCFQMNPTRRATLSALLNIPWLKRV
jgi:serine/threonine-protein kinase HSL1 (negative regulator of Swe1 kinase)